MSEFEKVLLNEQIPISAWFNKQTIYKTAYQNNEKCQPILLFKCQKISNHQKK